MTTSKRELGQFMTPEELADLVARQIPSSVTAAVDLAAGDCSLLRAAGRRRPEMALFGCEVDPLMFERATEIAPQVKLRNADGLHAALRVGRIDSRNMVVLGNPPFTETAPTLQMRQTLAEAFPGLTTRLGVKRLELYFLARSLRLAQRHGGMLVILMPMGFADGDLYRQYREILMQEYALIRAIELPSSSFVSTEARTVLLVIDTSKSGTEKTEIARYDTSTKSVQRICRGRITPGERLDARYHAFRQVSPPVTLSLQDLGVTIVRGTVSHKESRTLDLGALHTTDLARAKRGTLSIRNRQGAATSVASFTDAVIARTGDILLSRTGSRVSWLPVLVRSGSAPITDHVFRIRAPKHAEHMVTQAFLHPTFPTWLESIAKGVCATVVTKRELLAMPIFSSHGETA